MFDSVTTEELEFIKAIETYRARTGKTFLSWSEVLTIVTDLGYRRLPPKTRATASRPCQEEPAGALVEEPGS